MDFAFRAVEWALPDLRGGHRSRVNTYTTNGQAWPPVAVDADLRCRIAHPSTSHRMVKTIRYERAPDKTGRGEYLRCSPPTGHSGERQPPHLAQTTGQ